MKPESVFLSSVLKEQKLIFNLQRNKTHPEKFICCQDKYWYKHYMFYKVTAIHTPIPHILSPSNSYYLLAQYTPQFNTENSSCQIMSKLLPWNPGYTFIFLFIYLFFLPRYCHGWKIALHMCIIILLTPITYKNSIDRTD